MIRKALTIVAILVPLLYTPGCAFLASDKGDALTDLLARKTTCVLKYMDRPPVEWIALCGIEEGDLSNYKTLAAAARGERDAAIARDRATAACGPSR